MNNTKWIVGKSQNKHIHVQKLFQNRMAAFVAQQNIYSYKYCRPEPGDGLRNACHPVRE